MEDGFFCRHLQAVMPISFIFCSRRKNSGLAGTSEKQAYSNIRNTSCDRFVGTVRVGYAEDPVDATGMTLKECRPARTAKK